MLTAKGFHVILRNGKFTKNIRGKKTDVEDCQWIQKLHSLGLLKRKLGIVKRIQKQIDKFALTDVDLRFVKT